MVTGQGCGTKREDQGQHLKPTPVTPTKRTPNFTHYDSVHGCSLCFWSVNDDGSLFDQCLYSGGPTLYNSAAAFWKTTAKTAYHTSEIQIGMFTAPIGLNGVVSVDFCTPVNSCMYTGQRHRGSCPESVYSFLFAFSVCFWELIGVCDLEFGPVSPDLQNSFSCIYLLCIVVFWFM